MPDVFGNPSTNNYVEPPTAPAQAYGLSQRIAAAFSAFRNPAPKTPTAAPIAPQVPAGTPTQDNTPEPRGWPDANYLSAIYRQWSDIFQTGFSRQRRYKDYEMMDTSQVAAMLDSVVDSVLVSDDGQLVGFKVEAQAKYQTIIDQINHDLNLQFSIREILRDVLKYGDNFIGLVLDEYWNIRDYDNPPCEQMYRFTDNHLRLLTGTEPVSLGDRTVPMGRAFQQKNLALSTVAGWQPFEMFHLRYVPKKRLLYSEKSFLEDFRADFYKMRLIEESLVMHRVTRAAPRLDRVIDAHKLSDQEAQNKISALIKQQTQTKLSNDQYVKDTLAVDEDYWRTTGYVVGPDNKLYPKLDDIKMLDPRNTGIMRLDDVNHFVRKQFARVPSEIVGILPDREDISQQDIAASRLYRYCQFILTEQLLRPLYNLGLSLRGYVPEEGDYRIVWPSTEMRSSWRVADAKFRQSMADSNEIQGGLNSRKRLSQAKYGWTDEEWKEVQKEIEDEAKTMPPIPKATDVQLKQKGNNSA